MKIQVSFYNTTPIHNINFCRTAIPVSKLQALDSFQKSAESIKLENLYAKLYKMTGQVSSDNIEALINKLRKYPKEQVLLVLNKLTGFSNTDKIVKFKTWLESQKIEHIESFQSLYERKKQVFDYDKVSKVAEGKIEHHQVVKDKIPIGQVLNVNSVFSYFYNNGYRSVAKCPLGTGRYNAVILDSRTIDFLEEIKIKNPSLFDTFLRRYKFVYIKDFEGSYNIFEQYQDLEKLTNKKLSMLNILKKSHPERSDEDLMNIIMNGKSLKRINKLGIEPLIADLNNNSAPSSKDIALNLSQTFPEKNAFIQVVSQCLDKACCSDEERLNLIDYLDNNIHYYSFKSLGEKLVKLKQLIENDVKKAGRDISKIYYNVARMNKSFTLINYMYQLANDIPPNRFIYWENMTNPANQFGYKSMREILPKNSTVVILDDAFISGESVLMTQFRYIPFRDKDSFNMIFGSIYSSDKAKELLDLCYKKVKKDRILSVDNQKLEDIPIKDNTFEQYKNTLIFFPYNSPDNNSIAFQDLYPLFYPSRSFVQSPWIYE